jgi:CheY-like chemotaxis protein
MEASRTPETAQPGAAFDSGSDAAPFRRRLRLRSINDGSVERTREGSGLGGELLGCERRRLGDAEAFAISFAGYEQLRVHPSRSLLAHGRVLPEAQPVVARNGRFAVDERPLLRLVRKSRPAGEAGSRRVLVVDDDAGTRKLCSVILELAALEVIEARDGRAGLVRARLQRPDLIVTDVMMPGLDGFQLVEALRQEERTRAIPVIFMSGDPEPGSHARAFGLGAAAYITKPFNPVSFASLVARLVSRGAPPRNEARKSGFGAHARALRIATEVLDFGRYDY